MLSKDHTHSDIVVPVVPLTRKQKVAKRAAEVIRLDKLRVRVYATRNPATAAHFWTKHYAWEDGKIVRKEVFRRVQMTLGMARRQWRDKKIQSRRIGAKIKVLRRAASAILGTPEFKDNGVVGVTYENMDMEGDIGQGGDNNASRASNVDLNANSDSDISLKDAVYLVGYQSENEDVGAVALRNKAARAIMAADDEKLEYVYDISRWDETYISSDTDYLTDIELEEMYRRCTKRRRKSFKRIRKRRHCAPYPLTETIDSDSELSEEEGAVSTISRARMRRHRYYTGNNVYSEKRKDLSPAATHRAARQLVKSLLKPIVNNVLSYISAVEEIERIETCHKAYAEAKRTVPKINIVDVSSKAEQQSTILKNGPPQAIDTEGMSKNQRRNANKKFRNRLALYNEAVSAAAAAAAAGTNNAVQIS